LVTAFNGPITKEYLLISEEYLPNNLEWNMKISTSVCVGIWNIGKILLHITVEHINKSQTYHENKALGHIIIKTKFSTPRRKITSQSKTEIEQEEVT